MGCGASKTADGRGKERGEQSRDKAPPRGRGKSNAPPARTREDSQNDKYRQDEENKDGDDKAAGGGGKEEGTVLTANMISDLRSKASKEGGSSVMRWIDCIVEPQESDNVDMFDPMRRHVLSMDSVNTKMTGAKEAAAKEQTFN